MTEKIQPRTAEIIQFPVKARADRAGAQSDGRRAVERPAPTTVEYGSGWYHDAAIQEADQARHR